MLSINTSLKATPQKYDVLITGGTIIDGTGKPGFQADIGIKKDVIVSIGDLSSALATRTLDASEHVISPGFIDLHSHSDRNILLRPTAENNIRQGVTTLLAGNCGSSPTDLGKFFNSYEETGVTLNMAMLIGHNSIRRQVMNRDNRHATDDEMSQMKVLVNKAMEDGAFGLSSGLIYIPGNFAPPGELVELAHTVKQYSGIYATHMRSEGKNIIEAVNESIEVGRQVGIPVHISHHKVAGPDAWGLSTKTLALIDKTNAEGLDISLDQYPYTASNTNLGVLFPTWAMAGDHKAFLKRLKEPKTRQKIKQGVIEVMKSQRSGDELWRIQISRYKADESLEGKTFEDILKERDLEVNLENAAELAIELQQSGGGTGIYHIMQDTDVEQIMRHPLTSVASDGSGVAWQVGNPHPRNYGTYPRTLAHYVRDKKVLTIEEAVRKMTTLPASRVGFTDRGKIAVGMKADIAVWNPASIQDHSTFTTPHQYSTGMKYVIVNGVAVLLDGKMTGERPGKPLRHNK